jgi:serine protease
MSTAGENTQRLVDSIRNATAIRPSDVRSQPARFSIGLRPDQSPQEVGAAIVETLTEFDPVVAPLSDIDDHTLVVTLRNRVFLQDRDKTFEAAYALADAFAADFAEPEVFHVMPAPDPARQGSPEESVDDFPPGCWAPQDPDLDKKRLWALSTLEIQDAWNFSTQNNRPSRGQGVAIAQPDTGVAKHSEIDPQRRVKGYNFVEGNDDPTDPLNYPGSPGHGTGTGSVVVGNERPEMSGAAPLAIHMPIRAVESVVRLSQIAVAEAIDFATAHHAQVISISLGGIPSFSLYRALQRAVASDLIVLAAAGNCVGVVVWPARYDMCIAVAGTNISDQAWRGTCHGPDVTISAPGENVYRAHVDLKSGQVIADVGQGQGTSFATALIAGIAACWLAHKGRANIIDVAHKQKEMVQDAFRRLLRATARRPNGWDTSDMGAGIANAQRLLAADLDLGLEQETAIALGRESPEDSIKRFVAELAGSEAAAAGIDWKRYGPEIALALLTRKTGQPPPRRGVATEAAAVAARTSPALSTSLASEIAKHQALADALGMRSKI